MSRLAAEIAAGLSLYFNKALGNNLLYRFERGQYQEQYKKLQGTDKQMSSIYGGEHLLRLFGEPLLTPSPHLILAEIVLTYPSPSVNLPELLAATSLDPESMSVLKENMVQFLACVAFVPPRRRSCAHDGCSPPMLSHRWMDLNRRVLFVKEYNGTSSGYQNNNRG